MRRLGERERAAHPPLALTASIAATSASAAVPATFAAALPPVRPRAAVVAYTPIAAGMLCRRNRREEEEPAEKANKKARLD